MGALTGNAVQSTYLDLVQLGKSGAGLPSHAGKEAAVYDGSGAQILGRTAVRHWLDPHPGAAAFAETWEFSTKGTMTQGQLEAAGWTFSDCTGSVSNGVLWVERSSSAYWKAYLTTNFTGDFDVVAGILWDREYSSSVGEAYNIGGMGVGDTSNNVTHFVAGYMVGGYGKRNSWINGAWTTLGGTNAQPSIYTAPEMVRVSRVSGTVYLCAGSRVAMVGNDDTTADRYGWSGVHTVADADTFDRLYFQKSAGTGVGKVGIYFIRRFQ